MKFFFENLGIAYIMYNGHRDDKKKTNKKSFRAIIYDIQLFTTHVHERNGFFVFSFHFIGDRWWYILGDRRARHQKGKRPEEMYDFKRRFRHRCIPHHHHQHNNIGFRV